VSLLFAKFFNIFTHNRGDVMDITGLVIFLVIGALAGWLAGTIMKGGGFGLLGNIVVGIIGSIVGGFVFGLLGISAGGLIGSIITATAGAVLLLFIVGILKKA
jgi:uncharacterized membrane protein YeaQ/YmgE (transglycosylase-associated protein family)